MVYKERVEPGLTLAKYAEAHLITGAPRVILFTVITYIFACITVLNKNEHDECIAGVN